MTRKKRFRSRKKRFRGIADRCLAKDAWQRCGVATRLEKEYAIPERGRNPGSTGKVKAGPV
jgi:hypothetical protein